MQYDATMPAYHGAELPEELNPEVSANGYKARVYQECVPQTLTTQFGAKRRFKWQPPDSADLCAICKRLSSIGGCNVDPCSRCGWIDHPHGVSIVVSPEGDRTALPSKWCGKCRQDGPCFKHDFDTQYGVARLGTFSDWEAANRTPDPETSLVAMETREKGRQRRAGTIVL